MIGIIGPGIDGLIHGEKGVPTKRVDQDSTVAESCENWK